MKRRIAVRGIIVKDNTMFAQRLKHVGGETNSFWCTPGGGLDEGESLLSGLSREMIEETGISPVIGNLLYVQQYKDNDLEHIEFFFHITNTDDYENVDLSATSHGQAEVAEYGFIDLKSHNILPAFLSQADFGNVSNQAVEIFDYEQPS